MANRNATISLFFFSKFIAYITFCKFSEFILSPLYDGLSGIGSRGEVLFAVKLVHQLVTAPRAWDIAPPKREEG